MINSFLFIDCATKSVIFLKYWYNFIWNVVNLISKRTVIEDCNILIHDVEVVVRSGVLNTGSTDIVVDVSSKIFEYRWSIYIKMATCGMFDHYASCHVMNQISTFDPILSRGVVESQPGQHVVDEVVRADLFEHVVL